MTDERTGDSTESYRDALVRFARGYVGDEAEDVVQDVLARHLQAGAAPQDLRAWLYAMTRNACLNQLRGTQRLVGWPEDLDVAMTMTGALTRMERDEAAERLREAVAELPLGEREALRLRYADGLSRTQIAEVLEIPAARVKSWLFSGLQRMRRALPETE